MSDNIKPTEFKRSCDSKVKFYGSHKNSIGFLPGPLESGGTCKECTTGRGGCWYSEKKNKTCYVDKLMNAWPAVKNSLSFNTKLLLSSTKDELVTLFDNTFTQFEKEVKAREKRAIAAYKKAKEKSDASKKELQKLKALYKKTKNNEIGEQIDIVKEREKKDRQCLLDKGVIARDSQHMLFFRLYWSGDVDSVDTAFALMEAIAKHPNIKFWMYTRSFTLMHHFIHLDNLRLYVSLDKVNKIRGIRYYEKLGDKSNVSLCYMGDENVLNYTPCPVDTGKLNNNMACSKCRLCLRGTNIWFNTMRNKK